TSLPCVTQFIIFTAPSTTEIYTLSLHDALPIFGGKNNQIRFDSFSAGGAGRAGLLQEVEGPPTHVELIAGPKSLDEVIAKLHGLDRKSTRLNSSHVAISYAVFCLKKKKKIN